MMTKLYTMGFTKKSAEDFFTILGKNNVEKILDIRLNNDSHLSSFARKKHLPFLLERILRCKYDHLPILAPTDKLFQGYKKKTITWPDYKKRFMDLMDERKPENFITEAQLHNACFLCSEPSPEGCHRRLAAEYFAKKISGIRIKHL